MKIELIICVAVFVVVNAVPAYAQQAQPPDAAAALAAYEAFRTEPESRLDRTQPFLDYIRSSGEVHIVLNDALLAWMYDPIDPAHKAVLYAAFLGGNMAAQLERGDAGSDNIAGMASALDAYLAIRARHPEFELPLFERLAAARADNAFAEIIESIAAGSGQE